MTSSIDPPQPDDLQPSDPPQDLPQSYEDPEFIPEDQWLDHGLKALKEGDYLTALSYLSSVAEAQAGRSAGYRAQMGMVAAYERHGQPDQAIALCRQLQESPSSKIRTWADQTMLGFRKRYADLVQPGSEETAPGIAPPAPTGFVPLEGISSKKKASRPRRTNAPIFRDATNSIRATSPPPRAPQLDDQEDSSEEITAAELASTGAVSGPNSQIANSQIERGTLYRPTWQQAGRAKQWRPLKQVKPLRLWLIQGATLIALVLTLKWTYIISVHVLNFTLKYVPLMRPFWSLYYIDPTPFIIGLLAILLVFSPWLMDGLLQLGYGMKPLPVAQLSSRSPETTRLLTRFFRQRNISVPPLRILPTPAPLLLTYGSLPRFSRIAVSQGFLDQLADDEIAAIFATQIGHIVSRDFIFLSAITLLTQIPYQLYWQSARLGNLLAGLLRNYQGKPLYYLIAVGFYPVLAVSSLSYGLFKLSRWPTLWFSRSRIFYSDRVAAEATGNPNGLIRGLLKMAIGQAESLQSLKRTLPLLESFESQMPVGYQTSLMLGSLHAHAPLEPILKWDVTNPMRHWLALNNTHPLMGERLWWLATYAQQWRLQSEINLSRLGKPVRWNEIPLGDHLRHSRTFFLQTAPLSGIVLGILVGLGLWIVGGIALTIDLWQISWMFADPWLMLGCLPLGFSVGTFVRINPFFPDINTAKVREKARDFALPNLLSKPEMIPVTPQPVFYQGILLGRRGVANRLGQDLVLQTEQGLIRLHHCSMLGPIGTTLFDPNRPEKLVGQVVTAVGWFRRGATPWIDLESLRAHHGQTSFSQHPIWSTLLGILSAIIGSYIILAYAGRSIV